MVDKAHGFIDFSFLFALYFIDLMLFITSLYLRVQVLFFCSQYGCKDNRYWIFKELVM